MCGRVVDALRELAHFAEHREHLVERAELETAAAEALEQDQLDRGGLVAVADDLADPCQALEPLDSVNAVSVLDPDFYRC
ncbi:MAG TPA: hypothetical protein VGI48_07990 [Caldimonas sp.]